MKKLLIANRGEIAVRVVRAARQLGIPTVAVYSDADATAIHTRLADEAVPLGGSEPSDSYLNIDKVLQAIASSGATAVHPGYGFLSERAEFAEACASAGIVFVGPPADAMRRLGSKTDAKRLAVQEAVPIVPGYFESDATPERLRAAADDIGYPIMLKASAGGGGRGMRVVRDAARFHDELQIASDEALKGFGDGSMMVEKLIERPRHVEVQILADKHGQVAALFERECSLQRRHQKVIEEAPSLVWDGDLAWEAMRDAAIRLVCAAGYVGAGTVEFIVDPRDGKFYFLEVNARLQVEHPVTEAITGIDLVQWQLRIADGERLELAPAIMAGDRRAIDGHSIEARVVAEDPAANFLPSVGKILKWLPPADAGVRLDTGYGDGAEIPRFYDSLVAKVIVHAETRPLAIQKLKAALLDFHILGVKTNIAYLLELISHPAFLDGEVDTDFIGREISSYAAAPPPATLGALVQSLDAKTEQRPEAKLQGAWSLRDGFRNAR